MRPLRNQARRTQARGVARARYADYIVSDQWWQKRRDWLKWWVDGHDGENPACVVCGEPWQERRDDLHHRTYARLGNEQPEDLTPMCRTCHTRLHDIIDVSPGWRRADRAIATDMIVGHLRAAAQRERAGRWSGRR